MSDSASSSPESTSSTTSTRSMTSDKGKIKERVNNAVKVKDTPRKNLPPPQGKPLTIFELETAKTMSYEAILNLITRFLKRHDTKSPAQADAYTNYLLERIHKTEKRHDNIIELKDTKISQLEEDINEKDQKIKFLEQQLLDQCQNNLLNMANESQNINNPEKDLTNLTQDYEELKEKFVELSRRSEEWKVLKANLMKERDEWKDACNNWKRQTKNTEEGEESTLDIENNSLYTEEDDKSSSASQTGEEEITILQRKNNKLKKRITNLEKENQLWQTECKDWKMELRSKDKIIKLLQQMFDHIQNQNRLLSKDEQTALEIHKLNKALQEKEKIIFELDLNNKSLETEIMFLKTEYEKKNDQFKTVEKLLLKYEEQIEYYKNQLSNNITTQEVSESSPITDENTQVKQPLQSYANITSTMNSTTPNFNQSAKVNSPALILRKNTKITRTKLKEILYTELKGNKILSEISCFQGRDPETIIIKADNEEKLNTINRIIQDTRTLKDTTTTTIKQSNTRKILVLGIPTNIPKEEITQRIKADLKLQDTPLIYKQLTKKNLKTYQLVLEVGVELAQFLLAEGKVSYHFYNFKVVKYSPIVRCNNCQYYGHSQLQCNYKTACPFCTKVHIADRCPIKEDPSKYRCINCIENNEREFKHATYSPSCAVYKYLINKRNLNNNGINSPSQ